MQGFFLANSKIIYNYYSARLMLNKGVGKVFRDNILKSEKICKFATAK